MKIPTIETAEKLQGFQAGWTAAAPPRLRWRLVGNAVSPPVVSWIAKNFSSPGTWDRTVAEPMPDHPTWPLAAWGNGRGLRLEFPAGEGPANVQFGQLSETNYDWVDLSPRALAGFVSRAREGGLNFPIGFLDRLEVRLR